MSCEQIAWQRMHMKKKVIASLLAFGMVFTSITPVYAQKQIGSECEEESETVKERELQPETDTTTEEEDPAEGAENDGAGENEEVSTEETEEKDVEQHEGTEQQDVEVDQKEAGETQVVQEDNTSKVDVSEEEKPVTEDVTAQNAKKKWTIGVYMCGSDLESGGGAASTDILEMLSAKGISSEDVNLVIETGGSKKWFMDKQQELVGDEKICSQDNIAADKIQRHHIEYDGGEYGYLQLDAYEDSQKDIDIENGAGNMADQAEFTSFLEYCDRYYPAEHSAVVLWNHGGGSVAGVCFDEYTDGDSLSLTELKNSLEHEKTDMGAEKHDLIGFDACLMGSFETALVLAPYADYMIGSQNVEPGDGWYYTPVLDQMGAHMDTYTAEQMGSDIIDAYQDYYKESTDPQGNHSDADTTLAMYDLKDADALRKQFDRLAKELLYIVNDSNIYDGLKSAIDTSMLELNTGADMCDLLQFLDATGGYLKMQKDAMQEVEKELLPNQQSTYQHIQRYIAAADELTALLRKDSETDTQAMVIKNYTGYGEGKYVTCGGISFYYPKKDSQKTVTAIDEVYDDLRISESYAIYAYEIAYLIESKQLFQGKRSDYDPVFNNRSESYLLDVKKEDSDSIQGMSSYKFVKKGDKKYIASQEPMEQNKKGQYVLNADPYYLGVKKAPVSVEWEDGYFSVNAQIDGEEYLLYYMLTEDGETVIAGIDGGENGEYYSTEAELNEKLAVGTRIRFRTKQVLDGNQVKEGWTSATTVGAPKEYMIDGESYTVAKTGLSLEENNSSEISYSFVLMDYKYNMYELTEKNYTKAINFAKAVFSKISDRTYTGKKILPKVKLSNNKVVFKEGSDYTVSYKNNVKIGKATVIVKGKKDYKGIELKKTFKIVPIRLSSKDIRVTYAKYQVYTGKAVRPAVRIQYKNKYLLEGSDYTVSYQKNVKIGQAKMIIKGKGIYAGTLKKTFSIVGKAARRPDRITIN